jgi:anti-anti-sigma regulatory factor
MLTNQIERKTKEIEAFTRSTLEVEIENHSPSIAVVRVSGEANPDQADYLTRQLISAAKQDPRFVILDLAGLTFISRAALAHLEGF